MPISPKEAEQRRSAHVERLTMEAFDQVDMVLSTEGPNKDGNMYWSMDCRSDRPRYFDGDTLRIIFQRVESKYKTLGWHVTVLSAAVCFRVMP